MRRDPLTLWEMALLALAAYLLFSGGGLPIIGGKATAVTYVHDEKANIPAGVLNAINELNARGGIVASNYPDDATDNDDDVPEQYKVTLPAAKAVGIPALVVQAGDRVLRTVKAPTTKAEVLEAVR